MTFKGDQNGGVRFDTSIPIWTVVLIVGLVVGWLIYGVRFVDQQGVNTETIEHNTAKHSTEWKALDLKFEALDDSYNAQAVSIGVIQATVEFNRGTLSDISAQIQELGSNR